MDKSLENHSTAACAFPLSCPFRPAMCVCVCVCANDNQPDLEPRTPGHFVLLLLSRLCGVRIVRHYAQVAPISSRSCFCSCSCSAHPGSIRLLPGRDYWRRHLCSSNSNSSGNIRVPVCECFTVETFLQLAASAASLHMKLQMYAGVGEKWVVRRVRRRGRVCGWVWVISINPQRLPEGCRGG